MITVDSKNIKSVVMTLKGVMPANYDSMDRLVAVVSYFEALLEAQQKEETKPEEVAEDG